MPPSATSALNRKRELIKAPFGPYLDEEVLSGYCKSTPTNVLALEDVMFQYNGRPAGLDQIEGRENFQSLPKHIQRKHRRIPAKATIYFRGVLTVQSLKQLTDRGNVAVGTELARRYHEKHPYGDPWSIKAYFNESGKAKDELAVKILIQGEKSMPAIYMAGDGDELVKKGLKLTTKDRNRIYEVLSLDTETYELSRTFLHRYHTLHTLEELHLRDQSRTARNKRTPDWFASRYIHWQSYAPPTSRWRRTYYLEDAVDSDSGSDIADIDPEEYKTKACYRVPNEAKDPEDRARRAGRQTRVPRRVRKPHRAEILSVFASHCEWIIMEQMKRQKHKRILDVDIWQKWRNEVVLKGRRVARARRPRVKWGVRDEYDGSSDSDSGGDDDDNMQEGAVSGNEAPATDVEMEVEEEEDEEIQIIVPSRRRRRASVSSTDSDRPAVRPARNAKPGPSRDTRGRTYKKQRNVPKPVDIPMDVDVDDAPAPIYNSDFSSSSSNAPDSRASSRSPSPHPIDPEIISLVNNKLSHTFLPPLLRADSTWHCEVKGCGYVLDMTDLKDDEVQSLSSEDVKGLVNVLRQQVYKWPGKSVFQKVFMEIVGCHYEEHWREEDLKIVARPHGKTTFEWINPKWHRQWPPPVKALNNPRAFRDMVQRLERERGTKDDDEVSIEL